MYTKKEGEEEQEQEESFCKERKSKMFNISPSNTSQNLSIQSRKQIDLFRAYRLFKGF
jgi:hypothetical protein